MTILEGYPVGIALAAAAVMVAAIYFLFFLRRLQTFMPEGHSRIVRGSAGGARSKGGLRSAPASATGANVLHTGETLRLVDLLEFGARP
jgi:hypothetical protein